MIGPEVRSGTGRPGHIEAGSATWFLIILAALVQNAPQAVGAEPTYSGDVARILQKNCQGCHRPGEIGPFALDTYEQARKRAGDIAEIVGDRRMPPWKPTPGVGLKLKHDRSLAQADIALLVAWAEAGAPEGERAHLPPPVQFTEGWKLGEPDLVVAPAEAFSIPAGGSDLYRCFVIPTDLPNDVYVSAVEFRPGNRRVVHHMMAFLDTHGNGRKKDADDPGPGYASYSGGGVELSGDLGGWAAGNEPIHLPEGVGRLLPCKADILLQVHYHPSGKPETDLTKLGLYFARKPVRQSLQWNNASNMKLKLTPGNSNIEVKAKWYVPVDVEALALTPHMHQLGRDITISVTFPGGHSADLMRISDWDASWQSTYYFEKPITLPRGSVVNVLAHYDNSDANPRNPNRPPKPVTWGFGVNDEMCVVYIGMVKKGQDLTRPGEKDDLFDIFAKQYQDHLWRDAESKRHR